MASLPALFRTSLRIGRTPTAPCTCTCTRSLSSSLARNASNGSRRPPPPGATPRFADVDWSDGSVAQKKPPRPAPTPSPAAPSAAAPRSPPPSKDRSPSKAPLKERRPWKPRGPARQGRAPRRRPPPSEDPRLPTKSRLPAPSLNPSTADLSPEVLHEYRLDLITLKGRTPSPEEMEKGLPTWLGTQRRKETEKLKAAFYAVQKAEKMEEQLDVAWEWARMQEEKAGVRRSEADQKRDVVVRARVLERARKEELLRQEEQKRKEEQQGIQQEKRKKLGPLVEWPKELSTAPNTDEQEPLNPPEWYSHKKAMKKEFPAGWAPPKRISREAIDLLRLLQRSNPTTYTTPILAERFKISPESVRRILKSQFELSDDEKARREDRRRRENEERRRLEAEEGKTWAGDWMGERAEMLEMREGGLVTVREARKPKSRKQQEEAEEKRERDKLREIEMAREKTREGSE